MGIGSWQRPAVLRCSNPRTLNLVLCVRDAD